MLKAIHAQESRQMAQEKAETLFTSLPHAKAVLAAWKHDDNHHRPHSAHGGAMPVEFAVQSDAGHAPYPIEHIARKEQHSTIGLYF